MESSSLLHWLWLTPLALGALWVGSPRFLGTEASERLGRMLSAGLDRRRFTVLQHLNLSVGGSIMHFDCLVLSRSGIFVIDALYLPGQVQGQRVQAWWQRLHWRRKHRFANPVHENFLRLQALQQALHLAPACFHSCVAVSGHSSIDTDSKDIVMDVSKVAVKINSQTSLVLGADELNQALQRIQQLRMHAPLLGNRTRRWQLLRLLLLVSFLGGVAWVYRQDLQLLYKSVERASQPLDPATERQRWEERLVCSSSIDTGRCACYTPQGERAEIDSKRCQELSERGSILKQ